MSKHTIAYNLIWRQTTVSDAPIPGPDENESLQKLKLFNSRRESTRVHESESFDFFDCNQTLSRFKLFDSLLERK